MRRIDNTDSKDISTELEKVGKKVTEKVGDLILETYDDIVHPVSEYVKEILEDLLGRSTKK